MTLTSDPDDPRLTRGVDETERPQAKAYLVMSDAELARGFVRPVRTRYQHTVCHTITTMHRQIAETYAARPSFYGATYCVNCRRHVPVSECVWVDENDGSITTEVVGS